MLYEKNITTTNNYTNFKWLFSDKEAKPHPRNNNQFTRNENKRTFYF